MTPLQSSDTDPIKPRLQLRIDFDSTPSRPTVMEVELVGTRVYVDVESGLVEDAWGYLIAAGIDARIEAHSPIMFDAAQLAKLALLPQQVSVVPVGAIRTLLELVSSPPPVAFPVTLYVEDKAVTLRWFDGSSDHNVTLHHKAIPAFLTLQVAFIADSTAWDVLMDTSEIRPVVGKVRLNYEGFCEIAAITPQLVESAPIPALFRIDDTHFGFPAIFASQVEKLKGFQWEGRRVRPLSDPPSLPPTTVHLRPHLRKEIPLLAQSLGVHGGHLIVWDKGLGRRLAALLAVDTLDAYPALIVTTPWRVWLWQRQLEALGRSASTSHTRSDVQITTYHDIILRKDNLRPVTMILDDVDHPQALSRSATASLTALIRTYPDMYRLGISTQVPQDSIMQTILNLIRPGEFDDALPMARKYPGDYQLQFQRHMDCYVSISTTAIPAQGHTLTQDMVPRATVEVAEPTTSQLEAIYELRTLRAADPSQRLEEALEVISAGTSHEISPKIARAVAFITSEISNGHKVAVTVAHRRTITLLKAALASHEVHVAQGASGPRVANLVRDKEGPLVLIVHHRSTHPDISTFDAVLVLDYPWSMELLDHMLGDQTSAQILRILHLSDTPDDRLALFAAMRRELGTSAPRLDNPPTRDEAIYLLAPRHTAEIHTPHGLVASQAEGASHLLG